MKEFKVVLLGIAAMICCAGLGMYAIHESNRTPAPTAEIVEHAKRVHVLPDIVQHLADSSVDLDARLKRIEESNVVERFARFDAETERQKREKEKDGFIPVMPRKKDNPGLVASTTEKPDAEKENFGKAATTKRAHIKLPPNGGDSYHVTLFVDPNYEKLDSEKRDNQIRAVQQWQNDRTCLDLQARANGRLMRTNDPNAKPYWPILHGTPALVLIDGNGMVMYNETNPDLLDHPRQLMNAMTEGAERRRKNCDQNGICQIVDEPDNAIVDEGGPRDILAQGYQQPALPSQKQDVPMALAFGVPILCLLGGGFAFSTGSKVRKFKSAYHGSYS